MKALSLMIIIFSLALISTALYVNILPQPVVLVLVGLGFVALVRRFKDEENKLLTLMFK